MSVWGKLAVFFAILIGLLLLFKAILGIWAVLGSFIISGFFWVPVGWISHAVRKANED